MVKIIEYSGDEPDGVKVFSQIPGGEGNNFKKAQEGPGNGHGRFSEEELEELDEPTKALAEEFSLFMNPQNLSKMTPHVCRKGCKHYIPWGTKRVRNSENFAGSQRKAELNVIPSAGILRARTQIYLKEY